MEEASREILWNLSHPLTPFMMYGSLGLAMLIGFIGIFRHTEFVFSGKAAPGHLGNWTSRFVDLFSWGALQHGVTRERGPAIAHSLIYLGFLVLLFTTTMVFIDYDLGIKIYQGKFYLVVTLMSDLFGLGLLIGCVLAAHRRYILKPDLIHTRPSDGFMIGTLILLVVQGFLLEGLRIHATDDPWSIFSPVGLLVGKFFWFLSNDATKLLHFLTWWFHTLTVFFIVAVFPYTKFFHMLVSSANLFFRGSGRTRGALSSPGDIEKLMETEEEFTLGLGNIKDYSWKQLLDLEACTSCGRCQDVCPAYLSGAPLSPKWMILDTRNHALALHAEDKLSDSKLPSAARKVDGVLTEHYLLEPSGLRKKEDGGFDATGEYRGANQKVQNTPREIGKQADARIAGEVMDPDVFWSCTTCMACVEVCPVGINHVEQIVGNRRNMVLMEGEIPSEAQGTVRAIETRANPYGPQEERTGWIDDLDVKILEPGDSVDYLYWVGCVSAFDPRKQKIAQALVKLMQNAGLSFGILGTKEGCTGDPARRIGEENLFQTLAKQNMEVLCSIKFKNLVANCPHCFNTIRNEYPQFGNLSNGDRPEIIHHSQLLKHLVDVGKIVLKPGSEEKITYHDPCYLGRYNGEYEAPRKTLRSIKSLNIIEMDRSKEKGLCCGAGGGHFWMDLKLGDRVNDIRTDEAAATGASTVATACPFCMQMMEDGVKNTDREGALAVKDIAEVMLEHLDTEN